MRPLKILGFGDFVVESGFGRIGNETFKRLAQRGHTVMAASIFYDGMHGYNLPFYVFPLQGRDIWLYLTSLVMEHKPDVLITIQDYPYHQTAYYSCRIDFSSLKWVYITPVDGTPVFKDWAELSDEADGAMVISEFGVEAHRQVDKKVDLLEPGIDTKEFYPLLDKERKELRQKAGIPEDAFVLGTMCMNQGRKAIPWMLQGFFEFAKGKPNVRYLLDMDKTGGGGWDILSLIREMKQDPEKIIFKEDLVGRGIDKLNLRYNLLDLHTVLAHREGFGLPLVEAMACKVPSMAMDWCSGTEVVGGGKGYLIKPIPMKYPSYGTWGNAVDKFPDLDDFIEQLNRAYDHPEERLAIAATGYEWAIKRTWDRATDQLEKTIESALTKVRTAPPLEPRVLPLAAPDVIPAPAGLKMRNQMTNDQPGSAPGSPDLRDAG